MALTSSADSKNGGFVMEKSKSPSSSLSAANSGPGEASSSPPSAGEGTSRTSIFSFEIVEGGKHPTKEARWYGCRDWGLHENTTKYNQSEDRHDGASMPNSIRVRDEKYQHIPHYCTALTGAWRFPPGHCGFDHNIRQRLSAERGSGMVAHTPRACCVFSMYMRQGLAAVCR